MGSPFKTAYILFDKMKVCGPNNSFLDIWSSNIVAIKR